MELTIGIYVEEDKKSRQNNLKSDLRKIKQATKTIPGMFAKINKLENVDQLLLKSDFYQDMEVNSYHKFELDDEFNYLFNSSNPKCVIAISCYKTKLLAEEKAFLFKNIAHILLRPDSVKSKLEDIVNTPLNFIGKDLLIERIDAELEELMKALQKNIEKAIQRGESLDQLQAKALTLHDDVLHFRDKSIEYNRCCRM